MANALNPINKENYNMHMTIAIAAVGAIVSQGGKLLPIKALNIPAMTTVFAGTAALYSARAAIDGFTDYKDVKKKGAFHKRELVQGAIAAAAIAGTILAVGGISAVNSKLPSAISYTLNGDFVKSYVATVIAAGIVAGVLHYKPSQPESDG